MEADEAVDQQTRAQRAGEAALDRDDVGVDAGGTGGDDAGVEYEAEDGEEHVEVEEGGDFLAADGGELAAHVQDHDDGHGEGDQVHEVDRRLEDDRVGELDAARVAGREDGGCVGDGVDGADQRAEREGGLLT